jgi:hypothetical protein
MLYSNSDGLSSPYALHQLNPWLNFNALQGQAASPAWQQAAQQAAQQMALQQFLAQQLAAQGMQQPATSPQARPIGFAPNPSIGLPQNPAPVSLAAHHIAQSLYVLAQQLTQLAAQSAQFAAQSPQSAQSSAPGIFGSPYSYANPAFTNPAYGNQYFPNPQGPQFTSGLALH